MKTAIYSFAIISLTIFSAFAPVEEKLISKNVHIHFYSHTEVEDIKADNYKTVSTIDKTSGKVVFSVPMQSFEFEKALMQKHYNSDKFLDTQKYPKAKFVGNISNLESILFEKDGVYNVEISGKLSIKDVTKDVVEKGTITVNSGSITVDSKINIILADYHVAFEKGKPATNIAKTVEVTLKAIY